MPRYLPRSVPKNSRYMVFVDGENLAIRYKNLKKCEAQQHVGSLKDVYVWSNFLNLHNHVDCALVRSFYYTCAKGDHNRIEEIGDKLLELGITDPRVFKKNTSNKSKRVDITLATEMLSNAHHNNYEVAVLGFVRKVRSQATVYARQAYHGPEAASQFVVSRADPA